MLQELIIWGLVFIVSLLAILKTSTYFLSSLKNISKFFKISSFVIGIIIIAISSSFPELIVSVSAVLQGYPEIVIATVVGSNITNIFLIFGLALIFIKKIKINCQLINVDLPFLMGASLLFVILIWDGAFTWIDGLLCLLGLVVFVAYLFQMKQSKLVVSKDKNLSDRENLVTCSARNKTIKKTDQRQDSKKQILKNCLILIVSLIVLYIATQYIVKSTVELSSILNIGVDIISLGAVALGTSLLELVIVIKIAKEKEIEMISGIIIGSNVFNIFAVVGISSLFGVLIVPQKVILLLPLMLIATFLFFFMTQDRQTTQWEGWILIIFYLFFIFKLMGL